MTRTRNVGFYGWASASVALAVVIMVASCSDLGAQGQYKTRLKNTGEPSHHAVQNSRLRALMADLDELANKGDYGRPLELKQKHNESLDVAVELAASAGKLSSMMDKLGLSETERQIYLSTSADLLKHTLQYGDGCKNENYDEMHRSLELMKTTCNACHDAFRKM